MATKHMISQGVGLSPGSVKFIITRGLIAGVAIAAQPIDLTLRGRDLTLALSDRELAIALRGRDLTLTLSDR